MKCTKTNSFSTLNPNFRKHSFDLSDLCHVPSRDGPVLLGYRRAIAVHPLINSVIHQPKMRKWQKNARKCNFQCILTFFCFFQLETHLVNFWKKNRFGVQKICGTAPPEPPLESQRCGREIAIKRFFDLSKRLCVAMRPTFRRSSQTSPRF